MRTKTPLPEPTTAYIVYSSAILEVEVAYHYSTYARDYFPVKSSLHRDPYGIEVPSGGSVPINVSVSDDDRPFKNESVVWSKEDAVDLFRQRKLALASYQRKQAASFIADAETIEQVDYHKKILGYSISERTSPEPEPYVSPFTGETV